MNDRDRVVEIDPKTFEWPRRLPGGVYFVPDFGRTGDEIAHLAALEIGRENLVGIEQVTDNLLEQRYLRL